LAFPLGRVAAAEAGAIDPRVVAVANLDGWLSGPRAMGLSISLIWLSSPGTLSLPAPLQLQSLNPNNLLKHDSVGG
jgi:hypothetical protein